MLRSRFHNPAPALEQFVRHYVQREVRVHRAAVVHPVTARAAAMIEFVLGDPFYVFDREKGVHRKSPPVVVVGPQTYRRVELQLHGTIESFVIMFHPDGMHRLFSLPMQELTDQDCDGHSVLGSFASRVWQRLSSAELFEDRVRLVDEMLLLQSLRSPGFDGISAASHRIVRAGGRVGLAALAESAGLGVRQFERKFSQKVGMRPKLFARIARFQAALETKAFCASQSWTDVAHSFGYYDQMHMIHDFAEFTGETPTETLTQLQKLFVDKISAIRSGPSSAMDLNNGRLIL